MTELTLKQTQQAALQVLIKFKDICDKEGLRYFLYGGTLIGAIRHKGFIPWDDDLDVLMPRDDYQKFIEYCKKNKRDMIPFELLHYETCKKYIYPIARLSDSRYYIKDDNNIDYGLGVFIDIYPFDGDGNTETEVNQIWKKTFKIRGWIHILGLKKFKQSSRGVWGTVIKFPVWILGKIIGIKTIIGWLEKQNMKRKFDESKYVKCTSWEPMGRCFSILREDLEEAVDIEFEGMMIRAPKGYDRMLRSIYGNYMELPPEENRLPMHDYIAYLKES